MSQSNGMPHHGPPPSTPPGPDVRCGPHVRVYFRHPDTGVESFYKLDVWGPVADVQSAIFDVTGIPPMEQTLTHSNFPSTVWTTLEALWTTVANAGPVACSVSVQRKIAEPSPAREPVETSAKRGVLGGVGGHNIKSSNPKRARHKTE